MKIEIQFSYIICLIIIRIHSLLFQSCAFINQFNIQHAADKIYIIIRYIRLNVPNHDTVNIVYNSCHTVNKISVSNRE